MNLDQKKLNTIRAYSQILIGISLILLFLREVGFIKLIGMIGTISWIVTQVMFILKGWRK